MLCLERGEHTMKKTISLLLTAIMVFSLVPALFVRDGLAADDKYVKNSTSAAINVYKEANDASKVVATLPVGGVAKYVSSNGAFLKIENPAGYVKTSQVLLQSITLKAEGGIFLYDGLAHKVKVTLTNGTGFTVEFSTDGGKNWTTTVPSLTNAGKLKVKVRACKNSVIIDHKEITLEVTANPPEGTEITIIAHAGIKKAPVRSGATTSAAKIGTVNEGEKYQMIAREGSWYKFKYGAQVGYVYYWYVKVGAYSAETDKEPDPSKAKLTAKGGTYVYDGKEHKVTASLEYGDGYTIEYSTDGGKTWTKTAPGQKEVGKLTVKVRATGGSSQLTHKDVVVEVVEKVPTGTKITIVAHGSTTNAPVRAAATTSSAKIGSLAAGATGTLEAVSGKWVKVKVGSLEGWVYEWFVKTGTIPAEDESGEVADPSQVKLTASGGTFIYDGKAHKVTAKLENGKGYTIEYSTDGGKNWTTAVPSLTEAGKLTVKVRATGGGNIISHADVKLVITEGIPAGTDITIIAHGSQTTAPVRATASSSGAKVGTVTAGQTGKLVKQSGAWYKVKVGDVEGFVYNWFVQVGTIVVDDD